MLRKFLVYFLILMIIVGAVFWGIWTKKQGIFLDVKNPNHAHLLQVYQKKSIIDGTFAGRFRPSAKLDAKTYKQWMNNLAKARGKVGNIHQFTSSFTLKEVLKETESAFGIAPKATFVEQLARQMGVSFEKTLTRMDGIVLLRAQDLIWGHTDLIVYGSELESVAAATVAAREGMSVRLIHEKDDIGGLLVDGKLNFLDVPFSDGQILVQGFANEFYQSVGNGFDFSTARSWMKQRLNENHVLMNHVTTKTLKANIDDNGKISDVYSGKEHWTADFFIDASENGDLMAAAKAPFSLGIEESGRNIYPGATLIYELSGVDLKKINTFLKKRAESKKTSEGATNCTAWGFGKEMAEYVPAQTGILVRAPNISRVGQSDHVVCNHVIDITIDPLDPKTIEKSKERMKEEIKHLLPYLQKQVPGFEQAKLVSFAKDLYLRDSRHLKGKYRLKIEDLINRTEFPDTVLITNYPIDLHANSVHAKNEVLYFPQSYNIPYRCLTVSTRPNLLVSSKCASYSPIAAGSTRIVLTGTMMSEVAALASVEAWQNHCELSDINMTKLKNRLYAHGFLKKHPASLKKKLSQDKIDTLVKEYCKPIKALPYQSFKPQREKKNR